MKTTVKVALAAIVAGSTLAITSPAQAQTTSQYNHALVARYGCSTLTTDIYRRYQPSSVHGWLVVDFAANGGRWVHVSRATYPTVRALWADDLHPQAVCKR
jgi:hypothetical protein